MKPSHPETSSFGPLGFRDFRLLWIGLLLQGFGGWAHQVAVGWQILELSDSPLLLGLNAVFNSVPFVLASFLGGALADRMDRRRLLQLGQAAACVLALVQSILTAIGVIQVWHIYILTLLISSAAALDVPARQAIVPSLVPRHELMRAIALTSSIRRLTALVGPPIAGATILLLGLSGAYYLQALLLACAVVATALIRSPRQEAALPGQSLSRAVVEGIKYVARNQRMSAMLRIETVTQLLSGYVWIMPVFARDVLQVGPGGLGLLYAAPGVGAVIASVTMVALGDVAEKGRIYMLSAIGKPIGSGLFAVSPWMPTSLVMLGFVGLTDVSGGTARTTMFQLMAQDNMRGRVLGMDMMIHRGLTPLSGILLGALTTLIGAPAAMAGGSVIGLAYTCALLLRVPEVARFRDAPS